MGQEGDTGAPFSSSPHVQSGTFVTPVHEPRRTLRFGGSTTPDHPTLVKGRYLISPPSLHRPVRYQDPYPGYAESTPRQTLASKPSATRTYQPRAPLLNKTNHQQPAPQVARLPDPSKYRLPGNHASQAETIHQTDTSQTILGSKRNKRLAMGARRNICKPRNATTSKARSPKISDTKKVTKRVTKKAVARLCWGDLRKHDVVYKRGSTLDNREGNKQYLLKVLDGQDTYKAKIESGADATELCKVESEIVDCIFLSVADSGGRFLEVNSENSEKELVVINKERAMKKIKVELRKQYHEGDPKERDVICGRGTRTNENPANKPYLWKVIQEKSSYASAASKEEGTIVANRVIGHIFGRDGRFLQYQEMVGKWLILEGSPLVTKVKQCLRDGHVPEYFKILRTDLHEEIEARGVNLVDDEVTPAMLDDAFEMHTNDAEIVFETL